MLDRQRRGGARGDPQRGPPGRGLSPLHAVARLAASAPRAEERRPNRPRRLWRTGRSSACALPARPARGHLGPAARPGDAGASAGPAHPRCPGAALGSRWLPAIQVITALEKLHRDHPGSRSAVSDRSVGDGGKPPLLRCVDADREPDARRELRCGNAARARAGREAAPQPRSGVPATWVALLPHRHRAQRGLRSSTATPSGGQAPRSTSTTCSAGRFGNMSC